MDTGQERLWETIILINNIHCASCVTHIRNILASYGDIVRYVEVDSSTNAVRVLHQKSLSTSQLCQTLSNAAFEVYSATTSDESGNKTREVGAEDTGDAWLEAAAELWRQPVRASTTDAHCMPLPDKRRRNTHLANCDACRKENVGSSHESANSIQERLISYERGGPSLANKQQDDILPLEGDRSILMYKSRSQNATPCLDHEASDLETTRHEAVLSIGGMTCASCTSAIDHGLSELQYVESVSATLMTNSALVIFRGKKNLDKIIEAVEDLGYEGAVERCKVLDQGETRIKSQNKRRTVMLKIEGMFCKHCPPKVVHAINECYPDDVAIEQLPSQADPIIKVNYVPNAPNFTIRSIIATIDALDPNFNTNVYIPPSIEQRSQLMQKHEQRRLMIRLLFSFIVAIPTLLVGVVWMSLVPSTNTVRQFFEQETWAGTVTRADWALFILATPVFFLAADVFHVRAIKEIRILWRRGSKVPVLQRLYRFGSMNLLVSSGTSIAYFASVAVLGINATASSRSPRQSSTYFDSVVFLTFFILIGRYLEAYSKAKTGNAVAMLGNLRPQEAVIVTSSVESLPKDWASEMSEQSERDEKHLLGTKRINTNFLEVGDIVIVSHGSSPPADGIIVEGSTRFNESSLTGEARAVPKVLGDTVFSGAINVGGPISVKITEVGGTSMLDQIVAIVREGQTKRAPVERVVDFVIGYFVPVITALAIITFVIWLSLGLSGALSPRYLGSQQGGWAFWSLEFAIAVFVVACPCGIGLAAPTALFVGSGLAASHGILVRGGGEAFQEASNIDAVVFDKTGTLTEGGDLKVTDHEMLTEGDATEIAWSITKTLEENSSHPLARALIEYSSKLAYHPIKTISITEEPGLGLRGTFTTSAQITYEAALGSEALIASLDPPPPNLAHFTSTTLSHWKSSSKSVALLALRNLTNTNQPWTLALLFAITDPIRPTAFTTISTLQASFIPVYILTGDNPTTAAAVASTLSIPLDHVFAGVLPTQKADKIRWLQDHAPSRRTGLFRSRKPHATIAFIGDGINDAPALSTADVSISLSSASDIAVHSSSFILLSSSLESVTTLFQLSERVFRRVKFNFGWAVVYNVILIPVAAGICFRVREDGWRLSPVWGSAAMAGSSLCVVMSSLALRWDGGWSAKWVKRFSRRGRKGRDEAVSEGV